MSSVQSLKKRYVVQTAYLITAFVLLNYAFAQDTSLSTAMESITITSRKISQSMLEIPYSVYTVDNDEITAKNYRTTTDIFRDVPGAMSQKTSHGQGSPFLRGFTGFHNLFLVDGIKLNNAVFRSGPNQYWNTVDPLSVQRMEIVMGPSSVLFGSDGIGGTVNAITKQPNVDEDDPKFTMFVQGTNASNLNIQGLAFEKSITLDSAIRVSANRKDFGDIESGESVLPNTGYDEANFDIKWLHQFNEGWNVTFAHFLTHQQDVPRTHKTVFSVPFNGTEIGSELARNLDQKRQLTYFRVKNQELSLLTHFNAVLSFQQQDERRHRVRTGDRIDNQGFSVNTIGLILDSGVTVNDLGILFGTDFYRDSISSFSSSNIIQGPVADDASYTTTAGYTELHWSARNNLKLIAGLRYSHISTRAKQVEEPLTKQVISIDKSWSDLVGSFRAQYKIGASSILFAGLSEGFRAPNLSDLTRLDSARSNEFEIPSVNLDSENFVSYELGYRKRDTKASIDLAVYYTNIDNQIILFPNGEITDNGEIIITKSNQGDGYIYGSDISYTYELTQHISSHFGLSYQYGKTKSIPQAGSVLTEDYISRLMPLSGQLSIKFASQRANWWIEPQIQGMAKADKLSARDKTDIQRIPPNGTPSFMLLHIRGGYEFSNQISLNWAIENLFNKNYRVHGSGQNEVGRNLVASIIWEF